MKIEINRSLPRMMTIPGAITLTQYRQLQEKREGDIDETSARYLIDAGFAVAADAEAKGE